MMINRMPFKSQSMNNVHRSQYGTELWLGDYYAATNTALLKQKEIKAVLTSAAMLGVQYSKDHQINHKTINAFDLPSYKMTPHFEEAFQFIDSALRKGNLLVHCAAGISRSTTFVLVYLMRGEGMGFKQGLDYVRSKRAIICPNQGFQKELKRFQMYVNKMPKNDREKGHDRMSQSEQLNQKQVVLSFLKEEKPESTKDVTTKMSATSYGRPSYSNSIKKQSKTMMRGQSLQYGKNNINSMIMTNGNRNMRGTSSILKPDQRKAAGLTHQYLSFKLENPKIVTIKK